VETLRIVMIPNLFWFLVSLKTLFSVTQEYTASNENIRMTVELTWPNLSYYPDIRLEGMRKRTKNLSQYSQSSDRDMNPGPPEYEAGATTALGPRSFR
jgi:hypothetical protein